MSNIIFVFRGIETTIQCNVEEKLIDIYKRFETKSKLDLDISKLYFLCNGNKIDDINSSFKDIINKENIKTNNIKILINEIIENIENEKIIKSKEIICPKCYENILINIDEYKINLYDCKNGHKINNILFEEFEKIQNINISKIKCNNCKEKNKGNTYNNEFYRCILCNINLCPLCKVKHDNNHKIINYDNKNYICNMHNKTFTKYCKDCKLNICMKCWKDHKDHSFIDLGDIIINEEDNINKKNELNINIKKLNEEINNLIKILNKIKDNMNIYYNIYNNIINNYNDENINYEIINNINIFKQFNNKIINDINKIINENNINNKFNNIINIYNKMNDKNNKISLNDVYNNKINYKFKNEPQNLKYKFDIYNSNHSYLGVNDIFEIFICYKDNKEYIILRNENHNLDIYTLIDNKKINSLIGHKEDINTIRYFINNKNYNEYIISADENYIVIIWDITNNYNIKYQIDTKYNKCIFSNLLVFPHNINDNYIITSTISNSNDKDESATKIYSLNNGNFIKYIKDTNIRVDYLLSWYNKNNNEYYIIQLCEKKIIINNLLKDELYFELINEPEDRHCSGFIYNKDNNDYLCSSSYNGYINIWDLYNKNIFKVINTNGCNLRHIIQWNNEYIIVADRDNKSFKIINLENEKILNIGGQHSEGVECVKKIYHPKYGETLISADCYNNVKLWSF